MSEDLGSGWERPRKRRVPAALGLTIAVVATPLALEALRPDLLDAAGLPLPSEVSRRALELVASDRPQPGPTPRVREEPAPREGDPGPGPREDGGDLARGLEGLRARYSSILPASIDIPSTLPDLSRITTVADALTEAPDADDLPEENSPMLGYALGEEGISPEMAAAVRTVRRAHEDGVRFMDDVEVAAQARDAIGYVPNGVDPAEVRVPGGALEGPGREIVEGDAQVLSGHQVLVGGRMIRLQGVRAPGVSDICTGPAGSEFDCSSWAREGLEYVIGERNLRCAVTDREHEQGGRIGWCNLDSAKNAKDIASVAVRAGILLAVPGETGVSPYDEDAVAARRDGVGLWAGAVAPRALGGAGEDADPAPGARQPTEVPEEEANQEKP